MLLSAPGHGRALVAAGPHEYTRIGVRYLMEPLKPGTCQRHISHVLRTGPQYRVLLPVLTLVLSLPWKPLLSIAMSDDQYTYIVIAPILSIALIYVERARIFDLGDCSIWQGLPVMLGGLLLRSIQDLAPRLAASAYNLAILTAGAVTIGIGTFLACFGDRVFRRAAFPLACLFFTIPVPRPMMTPVIEAMQNGTAEISAILFRLVRLPAFRQGLTFSLPGFDIQIAEQCSGIRSCVVLCIASMLASHFVLRTWWRKTLLVAMTIPVAIFKNALRIVTISSLGAYVSPEFLHGALHRYSGIPFSLVEILILAPILIRWHSLDAHDHVRHLT